MGESINVWDVFRAACGSEISYSDNPAFDPARAFYASTADLVVADADDPSCAPRLVAEAAFLEPYRDTIAPASLHHAAARGPGL